MDAISELENALGAELLRAGLLGAARPKIGGRYIVERFLGRGANGLVVAALDDRLGRPVALKLGIATADTTMLAEARALALLDHPNVVRVHDVDFGNVVFDGRPFRIWLVSMQRVEGRNLRVWLREQPRSHQEILRVFVDAGHGLAAAHAAKIVHRDFKPDNVIVRNDGIAQVLDFGFAVPAASSESDRRSIQRNAAGTEPYMAPEARVGRATRKSDQFSFGVSLVEAFTGEPRIAPKGAPRGIPRALWSVLRRATSQDPSRRFPEMALLIDALSRKPPAPLWKPLGLGLLVIASLVMLKLPGVADYLWRAAGRLGRDAPTACASLQGTHTFYTTSVDNRRHGCYRVAFVRQEDCVAHAKIEKIWGGSEERACSAEPGPLLHGIPLLFEITRGGGAAARVTLRDSIDRDYVFTFTLTNGRLDGTFSTQHSGAPIDRGRITEIR